MSSTIRKITADGTVTTLAGMPGEYGTTDGTAGAARFFYPNGIAVDRNGNLYVADANNNSIRKGIPVGPQLQISRFGDQLLLAWPNMDQGFTLEATDDLGSNTWIVTTPAPVIVGDQNLFADPATGAARYFRLVRH